MSYLIRTPIYGDIMGRQVVRCTGCGESATIQHDTTVIRHACVEDE